MSEETQMPGPEVVKELPEELKEKVHQKDPNPQLSMIIAEIGILTLQIESLQSQLKAKIEKANVLNNL